MPLQLRPSVLNQNFDAFYLSLYETYIFTASVKFTNIDIVNSASTITIVDNLETPDIDIIYDPLLLIRPVNLDEELFFKI